MEIKQLGVSTDIAKIHRLFSKNLYSNKYSFIAEICQNAVDSHRMSGQKDPVIVGIRLTDPELGANITNFTFYVKDTGLSFSDKEDFTSKVLTLLESGKSTEKTNDENCAMGEYGIGTIAVCAYQSEWNYTVVTTDGREFTCKLIDVPGKGLSYILSDYKISDKEKEVLFECKLLAEPRELDRFTDEMQKKLAYFKDIQFEFDMDVIRCKPKLAVLTSTFKIFQAPDFQISTIIENISVKEGDYLDEMHISLDQYTYPINWTYIGMTPIYCPLALKFSMGDGLSPDLTRENLQVDENYKSIIKEKICKVADWVMNKYNETIKDEYESIKEIKEEMDRSPYITISETMIHLSRIIPYTNIPVKQTKMKGVSDIVLRNFLKNGTQGAAYFSFLYEISPAGIKLENKTTYGKNLFSFTKNFILEKDEVISNKKMEYLKQTYRNSGFFRRKSIKLQRKGVDVLDWQKILDLPGKKMLKDIYKSTGINIWRNTLNEAEILLKAMEKDYFVKPDDVIIPNDWKPLKRVVNRKEKVDLTNMTGEIGIKYAATSNRNTATFIDEAVSVKDLSTLDLHIYSSDTDKNELSKIFALINGWKIKPKIGIISPRQQKIVESLDLKNFVTLKDFVEKDHELYLKLGTATCIKNLMNNYESIINDKYLSLINKDIVKDIKLLNDWMVNHNFGWGKDGYIKEFAEKFDANKIPNVEVKECYIRLRDDIHNALFLSMFSSHNYKVKDYDKLLIKFIKDVIDTYCKTLDWKHYKFN